jgi:hypothetical protein
LWSLVGKNKAMENIVKLRERSIGITETSQKRPSKINVGKREIWNTHV